jgi:hypothetical protein
MNEARRGRRSAGGFFLCLRFSNQSARFGNYLIQLFRKSLHFLTHLPYGAPDFALPDALCHHIVHDLDHPGRERLFWTEPSDLVGRAR